MIRKFFGQGDVFIYATSDVVLQGEAFKKGDMISYFAGVQLALGYNLIHKESESRVRQLSYTEQQPYSLNIAQVPNTKEVDKLFFSKSVNKSCNYTTVRTYTDVKSIIFLKEKESPFKVKMFSKGEEIKQEGIISYNKDEGFIDLDKSYDSVDVISYFKADGEERDFNKPEIGYVTIKATIKGKIGDKDGTFVLSVPLADLVSEPVMDLTEESNYNLTLSFALINPERYEPKVVFIDG